MRVAHWHDEHLDQFVAKQVCHGWGAQRLMRAAPDLPWHGRDLKLASTWGPRLGRIPGMRLAGRGLAAVSIAMAPILERIAGMMPFQLAVALLGGLDKAAGLAGHLMYEPRGVEPSPSVLLGRRLPRD
jgi:hypothetical protein